MMKLNFYHWVIKSFLGHDAPAGALAYDMSRDIYFPKENSYDDIYDYLVYQREASQEFIDIFKSLWTVYCRVMAYA